jgi:hypothetical protein
MIGRERAAIVPMTSGRERALLGVQVIGMKRNRPHFPLIYGQEKPTVSIRTVAGKKKHISGIGAVLHSRNERNIKEFHALLHTIAQVKFNFMAKVKLNFMATESDFHSY